MKCACCSNLEYNECCEPYHKKEKYPSTAEALMRSRYSAFAIPNGEYLVATTLPAKRKGIDKDDLNNWGKINKWISLEIISTPTSNKVEFKAFYIDKENNKQIQHELSTFQKIGTRWFYVSGAFIN